ncbi:MAG: Putative cytochrome C-type biogenesis protein [uncultured Campylobacterales bacterium]|uniref:Cytochrome C-type biogenesis protein n=1 Tax=uncultured Campylobacterales bacterium TaxID=352960 RepID=A0A6S6SH95_9BACT|nr:MAG: Putative cytochrome C-type biogenesis protein [uncultured Campylobacterales bacterium]
MPLILAGLAIFAFLLGYATFIESIYSTDTAFDLVYSSIGLELLMGYLAIGLIINIIRYKMYRLKKITIFIFHISFIVIIIGAFITRYFGFEGMVHIREGESKNYMQTVTNYLVTTIKKDGQEFSFKDKLINNGLNNQVLIYKLNEDAVKLTFKEIVEGEVVDTFMFDIEYQKTKSGISLIKSDISTKFGFKDMYISQKIVSKTYPLGFHIKLNDFILDTYPGSNSPSSFKSKITLIDENTSSDHEIFMNNTLDHKGYRFFQSSYDEDEKGTVLSANYDPGKIPTYIGYFLLIIGLFGNLFNPNSRLRKLLNSNTVLPALLLCICMGDLKANDLDSHLEIFSNILVQDFQGRIKPINTLAYEISDKLGVHSTNKNLIEMLLKPKEHQQKIIFNISENLAQKLNIKENISYSDMFKEDNLTSWYILGDQVRKISAKPPIKRNKLDKEILKIDEKVNIMYMVYTGGLIRVVPTDSDVWLSPNDELSPEDFTQLFSIYLLALDIGMEKGKWEYANKLGKKVISKQKELSSYMPSDEKIKAEIMFYKLDIFKHLLKAYLILGLIFILLMFVRIYMNKKLNMLFNISLVSFGICFVFHIIGLGFRWYISGHAPWSNSYESMLYISFAIALAGIVLNKKSFMIIASSCILSGVFLFVAHLSWVDPQITHLVPVLKSYWLMIHVSVITASYGFFGLSFLIGIFTLIFMSLKRTDFIKDANKINEISIIIGVTLLTIGNFLGGIWANESWGRYWGWDAKETWALVSIIVYVMVLHLRLVPKLSSAYLFALSSVVAFSSILMTYFGVNHFLKGLHSYASGDPLPIPNELYFLIGFIALLALLAKVRNR